MDKPKAKNLSELTDEQIDAISGGYILDLCGMSNPTEYALVDDKTGDVICYANTLQGLKETRAARRCSDEIITLDDYQNIFGRKPWGDYE